MSSKPRAGLLAVSGVFLVSLFGAPRASAAEAWIATGSLHTRRGDAVVARLADGRVLAAGGWDYSQGSSVDSAEIYDPATGQWLLTGSMHRPRRFAGAVLLQDGRVFVAGGQGNDATTTWADAEIFDPVAQAWELLPSMQHQRSAPSTVLLGDGRVFVFGGGAGGYLDSAPVVGEIFDPVSQTWSPTSLPNKPRLGETATLLPDGRVLVAGGRRSGYGAVGAEIYDPATDTWTPSGPMVAERFAHTATSLADGRVLLVGGILATGAANAETFDPLTNQWTATGTSPQERDGHAAVMTSAGRVMVLGGFSAWSSVEIFDPSTGVFTPGPSLLEGRYGHRAVRLQNGAVLVVGGTSVVCEELAGAPQDGLPPTVTLTAPAEGAMLSGLVTVVADAQDDTGIARVDFYDGTVLIGSVVSPPYAMTWDASAATVGSHVLTARAFDQADMFTSSLPVQVTVREVAPPQVAITAPADDATISGVATITVSASDASGIDHVEFGVDSYAIGVVAAAPYSLLWDTSTVSPGSHYLSAVAFDKSGNAAVANYVYVTVAEPSTQAAYDPQLSAPRCAPGIAACDSGDLLMGRGPVGPEPNQPNTLAGSCSDGTAGSFHLGASLDRIRLSTLDGTALAAGKTVKVEATVWASSTYQDTLDLFYAADATAPQWVHVAQIVPQSIGQQTLFATYVLPDGPLQAIRGRLLHNSMSTEPCVADGFSDHDDLVFAVAQEEQAVYDVNLRAPKCSGIGPACTSGALLAGRGSLGPEPNGPNTTQGECSDGTGGTFHVASSIDAIRVATLDGAPMAAGQTVRVEATVWSGSASDRLDLFYSSATSWPTWTYVGSLTSVGPGRQVLSTNYSLPEGHTHVVRAVLRSWAWDQPVELCGPGPEDDSDDLWFVSDSGEAKQRLRIDMMSERGGSGTVSVISGGVTYSCSDPAGCDLEAWSGETAVLTATSAPDSAFEGWSGICSGTGPCSVLMDQMKWISARFSGPSQLLLRADGIDGGRGRIALTPAPLGGVAPYCDVRPETCVFSYPPNTAVQLVAQAEPGTTFTGWSGGGCVGQGPCEVTVPGAGYVSGQFQGSRALTVTVSSMDGGSGSVTVSPAPLGGAPTSCVSSASTGPVTCIFQYPPDTMVTLRSQAAADSILLSWGSACASTDPCQVQAGSPPVPVEAVFLGPQMLVVRAVGSEAGRGRVTVTPAPLGGAAPYCNVGAEGCVFAYPPNTTVQLVPDAEAGSTFLGWAGSPCAGQGACTLVVPGCACGQTLAEAQFLGPRSLTVMIDSIEAGGGRVTVTPAPLGGAAAECVYLGGPTPTPCVFSYPADATVRLSAFADPGSALLGWGPGCAGPDACEVRLAEGSATIGVTYIGPRLLTLTLSPMGGWGRVLVDPPSADGATSCVLAVGGGRQVCTLRFPPRTRVSLRGAPSPGSAFGLWSGACQGSGSCQLDLLAPSTSVTAAFNNGSGSGSNQAAYDTQLRVPKCSGGTAMCDSGTLLQGRATRGPEPHYPNTLRSSCADGSAGTYHSEESIDRIRVFTLDGSPLFASEAVKVEVTVWARPDYASDQLDLYVTSDAFSPRWTAIGTFPLTGAGQQVLSTTFTKPFGTPQAVRAILRYRGSPTGACVPGPYNDHDDLVFAY